MVISEDYNKIIHFGYDRKKEKHCVAYLLQVENSYETLLHPCRICCLVANH